MGEWENVMPLSQLENIVSMLTGIWQEKGGLVALINQLEMTS